MRFTLTAAVLFLSMPALADNVAPSQDGERIIAIPRPRPADLLAPREAAPAPKWQADVGDWPASAVKEARSQCAGLLNGRAIIFAPQAPLGRQGGCGASAPIAVSEIAGVTLTPPAIITCTMAARLHDWIVGDVQPAAQKKLRTRVTAIRTASSYACRRRNNSKGGKLSEHGLANALDMSGFTFATSKDVAVDEGWGSLLSKVGLSKKGGFLDDIRESACKHFATVLGPGSDAHHGDHFHVDAIQRKNDYRICK